MSGASAKPEQCIYSPELEAEAERLLQQADRTHLRIATAESCTGGALAALLTDIEGFSHVFERGFAVYSEEAKHACLGIPASLIKAHGAVSEEVAAAMARGALNHSRADIAVGITGYAGPPPPGESKGEEGIVHICTAVRGEGQLAQVFRFGRIGRSPVRMRTLKAALQQLEWAVEAAGGRS